MRTLGIPKGERTVHQPVTPAARFVGFVVEFDDEDQRIGALQESPGDNLLVG